MNAPALVLLAQGSPAAGPTPLFHALRKGLQMRRPHLNIQLAFTEHGSPSLSSVMSTLAHRDTHEVVLVPLDLTHAIEVDAICAESAAQAAVSHPHLQVGLARPIGPAPVLLNVLDDRLRAALRASRVTELDALVLAFSGHGDDRGNALAIRRARQWSAHHRLPCSLAFLDGSGTSTGQAVADLRGTGRRHIGVGILAIGDEGAVRSQCEAALDQGAVAVSSPLGADDRLLDLIMERYAYSSMALLDHAPGAPARLIRAVGD